MNPAADDSGGPDLEPGLLEGLADRGVLRALARFDLPAREGPRRAPVPAPEDQDVQPAGDDRDGDRRRRGPALRVGHVVHSRLEPTRYGKIGPVIANPYAGPDAYARDLARFRELISPHLLYPAAPIGPALAHITADDRAETIAILGRLGDPDESVPA
jgi:hypothetical protein